MNKEQVIALLKDNKDFEVSFLPKKDHIEISYEYKKYHLASECLPINKQYYNKWLYPTLLKEEFLQDKINEEVIRIVNLIMEKEGLNKEVTND